MTDKLIVDKRDKMAGKLVVNGMTNNKISVRWILSNDTIVKSGNLIRSTPFTLFTDGTLIVFVLIVTNQSGSTGYKVVVQHNLQKPVRAIITLSLDNALSAGILRTQLTESWTDNYEFVYPGVSLQSLRDAAADARASCRSPSSIIKCDITWLGLWTPIPKTPHFPKDLSLPSIPYTNNEKPDLKLIMGDKELSAHKNILTLHSSVFLGMFQAPMKESKENRVIIEDIDFSTMETLLKIIYSGETKELDNLQVALKVLAATEKYQMLTIKKACEYKLSLKVMRESVLNLLAEGDKYNAIELLKICIEYIIAEGSVIGVERLKKMCLTKRNIATALISTQIEKLYSIPSNEIRPLE